MTTQVNRCIENLRRVEAIKGCVLDQDDTLADLIGARSYKPHPEAGYTTDNLLLSLTVECLAMREETIYVPPREPPSSRTMPGPLLAFYLRSRHGQHQSDSSAQCRAACRSAAAAGQPRG